MAAALGVERLDDLGARVAKLLDLKMPGSFFDKLKKLGDALRRRQGRPQARPLGAVSGGGRDRSPVARHAARSSSAGRATPVATSRCRWCSRAIQSSGARNVGMYRLQVFDDQTLGMHWQIAQGLGRASSRRGGDEAADGGGHRARRRPLLHLLGVGPAAARRRRDGVLRLDARIGRPDGARARPSTSTCPPRPRSCWRAGSIPAERRLEGPFGDHTGYYSLARDYPVFHLRAITRRRNPIYDDQPRFRPA